MILLEEVIIKIKMAVTKTFLAVLVLEFAALEIKGQGEVLHFCTTSNTRERVPGVCRPLVKCIRYFHELPHLQNRPCNLQNGETGVCCPYYSVPATRSKCLILHSADFV